MFTLQKCWLHFWEGDLAFKSMNASTSALTQNWLSVDFGDLVFSTDFAGEMDRVPFRLEDYVEVRKNTNPFTK